MKFKTIWRKLKMQKVVNFFLHYGGTTKHKLWVCVYIFKFIMSLMWRALVHDLSKYTPSESKGFIKVIDKLKDLTYGSDEYKESLRSIKPSIDTHYLRNRHHPEHWKSGLSGMSMVDFVEMYCDWQAATKRHKDGDIFKSIINNQNRFDYEDNITSMLLNQAGEDK